MDLLSVLALWLAIGLTIMAPLGYTHIGSFPIQIGVSMLVGIWYVGLLLDMIQKKILQFWERK